VDRPRFEPATFCIVSDHYRYTGYVHYTAGYTGCRAVLKRDQTWGNIRKESQLNNVWVYVSTTISVARVCNNSLCCWDVGIHGYNAAGTQDEARTTGEIKADR